MLQLFQTEEREAGLLPGAASTLVSAGPTLKGDGQAPRSISRSPPHHSDLRLPLAWAISGKADSLATHHLRSELSRRCCVSAQTHAMFIQLLPECVQTSLPLRRTEGLLPGCLRARSASLLTHSQPRESRREGMPGRPARQLPRGPLARSTHVQVLRGLLLEVPAGRMQQLVQDRVSPFAVQGQVAFWAPH